MRSTKTAYLALIVSVSLVTPLAGPAQGDPATRAEVERRIAALPKGDAAVAYRLALEIEAQGYTDLAKSALERVITVDPDHAAARRALGYERVAGRWLAGDELRRAKGFVRSGKRWVLAEEVCPADPNLLRIRAAEKGLRSARSADRILATQEIARLGDKRGIPILVGAWARSGSGPGAVRGHFVQTRQMSFLKDFDVEVA